MVQLQLLGADGGNAQYGQPTQRPAVQLPDRSAENISIAQQTMAQANQTASAAIGLTNEAFANSALAAARSGANRLQTFNGVVEAVGQGVELYNTIQQQRLQAGQEQQAAALQRRVLAEVSQVKDQFGNAVASGMSELEARNLMRDSFVQLRTRLNNLAEGGAGGAYADAIQESFGIISRELDSVLETRNQFQLTQFEELRESALGVYQEQLSAVVNPTIVSLASVYTSPEQVRSTMNDLDALVASFAEQRRLTPIEALTLQRSVYQSANTYLTQRGVRIEEVESRNAEVGEVWNLVNQAYDEYFDPSKTETYQQGRILESRLGVIQNQFPNVNMGRLVDARSPNFDRQQLLNDIELSRSLESSLATAPSDELLQLSADAYNYLNYSYAFAYAFPGAIQTEFSVAQVRALGRDGDNPVVQGWVETGENLRQARNAYNEIENERISLQAEMSQRQAQVARLLDQLAPGRRGEYTTLNQQLNYLITVPLAPGTVERAGISQETFDTYRQWYQEDIEAKIAILENNASNIQSEWIPFGIDLSDPAGTAQRLQEWGARTEPERNRARDRQRQAPPFETTPNSPFINGVPQGAPSASPSFLQGQ